MSIATAAAVAGIASTAYSVYNQASASGGDVAAPPGFSPINIPQVANDAKNADIQGYNLADKDLATRLPGLVAGNKQQISDVYKDLTSPLDPSVQNAFATRALEGSVNSTGGGGNLMGIGQKGSAATNEIGANIANNVLAKQDQDRNYLNTVLSANPERAIGLGGSDLASLNIANTQSQNSFNQAQYQSQIAQKNADNAGGGM